MGWVVPKSYNFPFANKYTLQDGIRLQTLETDRGSAILAPGSKIVRVQGVVYSVNSEEPAYGIKCITVFSGFVMK